MAIDYFPNAANCLRIPKGECGFSGSWQIVGLMYRQIFPILNLPRELRNMIYHSFLVGECKQTGHRDVLSSSPPALLKVN
jgi:hypothetical protein